MSGIHYKNGGYITTSVKPTLSRNRGGSSVSFSFNPTYNDATTAIIDRSSNALSITNSGAVYSSATPFSGTNKGSMDFGNGDRLTASNSAFNFGTGDYTVMMWVNWSSTADYGQIFGTSDTDSFTTLPALHIFGNGSVNLWANGTFIALSGTSNVLSANTWAHVALTRSSGTTRIFMGGNVVASTTTSYDVTSSFWRIGASANYPSGGMVAKIAGYAIIKGTALYTATYTPPGVNEALGSLSGTTTVNTTTYGVYKLGY